MKKTAIHITKEASNTTIQDCEFDGFDLAVKNEGKNTKISGSIFRGIKKIWHEYFLVKLVIEIMVGLTVVYLAYKFGWNK